MIAEQEARQIILLLSMCVRFGMQSIPRPCPRPICIPCIHHACMLAYHITAAITACVIMAIPLTRANRLAAMRDSDERITSIYIYSHPYFLRGPLHFTYICPSISLIQVAYGTSKWSVALPI